MQMWKNTKTHVEKYKCENIKEYVKEVNIHIKTSI